MSIRRPNYNEYNIFSGVTDTEGTVSEINKEIVYILRPEDFDAAFDIRELILEKVTVPKDPAHYDRTFIFIPDEDELHIIWQDIAFAEIVISLQWKQVTQILYRLHTKDVLKYNYVSDADLKQKLSDNFGFAYDRWLKEIWKQNEV